MNCHHARQLISPYLDHQLTGRELLALQDHLAVCASCDRERQSLRQVKLLLRGLSQPRVPPGFSRNFSETIALRLEQPGSGPSRQVLCLPRPQRGRRLATALALSCLTMVSLAAPFAPEAHEALRASAAFASGGPAFPVPSSTDALLSAQPADHLLPVSPGASPSGFTVPRGDALTLVGTETDFELRPPEASFSGGQLAVFRPR